MADPRKVYRGKKISRKDCLWSEWRYVTMDDKDFEEWAMCRKCRGPLHIPKMLPCLHTVCYRCLQIHYSIERMQAKFIERTEPDRYNFMSYSGCFTCPLCAFPCYSVSSKLTHLPTNYRILALSTTERRARLKEIEKVNSRESSIATRRRTTQPPTGQGPSTSSQENSVGAEASASIGANLDGEREGQVVTLFHKNKPEEGTKISFSEALTVHANYVQRECRAHPQEILGEMETVWPDDAPLHPTLPENGYAHVKSRYRLEWGEEQFQVLSPSAVALNPVTGHVVVVDSCLNKALLYKKNLKKPWAHKKFFYPVNDVCFFPPGFAVAAREKGYDRGSHTHKYAPKDDAEAFCAMGRNLSRQGVIIYRVPFTKNPVEYSDLLQSGVREVSGLILLPEGRMILSLGYTNSVIIQLVSPPVRMGEEADWVFKFFDLATRRSHGLCNPTNLIQGGPGQVIVSDTNNHRIGVFYGVDYMASDFYCEFGHGRGQLFYPMGLAMDSRRHLFICDAGNHRVQVLNQSFRWHGFPIRSTYRMGRSVSQDVKPLDCAIDSRDRLLVLFKGRQFVSLQLFNYQGPLIASGDELSLPEPVYEDYDSCDDCCCCCWPSRRSVGEYEIIQ